MRYDDAGNLIQDLVKPKQWHHLCIGMDGESSRVYGVLVRGSIKSKERHFIAFFNLKQDGKILKNGLLPMNEKKGVVNGQFLEELVVKNCPDEVKHCFSSLGTNLTDLAIWSNSLTSDQMTDWTMCRYDTSTK